MYLLMSMKWTVSYDVDDYDDDPGPLLGSVMGLHAWSSGFGAVSCIAPLIGFCYADDDYDGGGAYIGDDGNFDFGLRR